MGLSFRPVKETWNIFSPCFIEAEQLTKLLVALADRVDTNSHERFYGDNTAVWIEDGARVLEFIETDQSFDFDFVTTSLGEGIEIDRGAINSLVENMKTLAAERRSSIGERGELVFYVD